jgi:hypothetical protein
VTLLPSSDFGIRGHPGKAYKANDICSVPGCRERSVQTHHLWPRSYLRGQPYEWVKLPDGTVVGNRTGLCLKHHDNVTGEIGGYKAHIVFGGGLFWWTVKDAGLSSTSSPSVFTTVGALDPQPPGVTVYVPSEHRHPEGDEVAESDLCSECGRPLHTHTKPHKPGKPREVVDWTLTVPNDSEIGGDELDLWADEFAVILGLDGKSKRLRRYHAVSTVMAWAIQNRHLFVRDIMEARDG